MSRFLHTCLILLVALTVGHIEVFGAHRGFICEDQGQPREVSAAHCHRTSGSGEVEKHAAGKEPAHAGETGFTPCENGEPEPDCPEGDVSQHRELKVKMESVKASDANGIAAPSLIPSATLTDIAASEHLSELIASQPCRVLFPRSQEEIGKHGTASALVAKSVILLI